MHDEILEENADIRFKPGDLVLHRIWQTGKVIDCVDTPEPGIIVDFPEKPNHRMSLSMASKTLTKMSPDGLEMLISQNYSVISKWADVAPLKLIAVALKDMGNIGKPSQLRGVISKYDLLGSRKWESWWKNVQPDLINSPHFTYLKSERAYRLNTDVVNIPETPLEIKRKRMRRTTIEREQIKEVVAKLESGELSLLDLKGEKLFNPVIGELVKCSADSEQAQSLIYSSLEGPIVPIRTIFKAIIKQNMHTYFIKCIVDLMLSMQRVIEEPRHKKKLPIEHILAKIQLVSELMADYLNKVRDAVVLDEAFKLINVFIDLSVSLCRKELRGWRSIALNSLSDTIMAVCEKNKGLYSYAGRYLSDLRVELAKKSLVTGLLFKPINMKGNPEFINAFLVETLERSPEYTHTIVTKYIIRDEQIQWVINVLPSILHPINSASVLALAQVIAEIPEDIVTANYTDYLEAATVLASLNNGALNILKDGIRSRFKLKLDSEDFVDDEQSAGSYDLIQSINSAIRKKLAEQAMQAESEYRQIEAKKARLEDSLNELQHKNALLEEVAQQLKTGIKLPEQWAVFEGKKEVFESLGVLYQELFLAGGKESRSDTERWLLSKIQELLKRHRIEMFGETDVSTHYQPSEHRLMPGSKRYGDEVVIICPGLSWYDPSNHRIVLNKAMVRGA